MLHERQCQENDKTSHKQGTTFGAHILLKDLCLSLTLKSKYSIEKNVNTVNLNASCVYLCMPVYLHQYICFT